MKIACKKCKGEGNLCRICFLPLEDCLAKGNCSNCCCHIGKCAPCSSCTRFERCPKCHGDGDIEVEPLMTQKEFLLEMRPEAFPQTFGPWLNCEDFDPKFTREELRSMRNQGLIQLDEKNKKFRLTLTATILKGAMA